MSEIQNNIRTGYDRWAHVYDHDANPLPALEEPLVQRLTGDVQGREVLDLGCGTGRHTQWLARAGARVTALDFSEGMLSQARSKPELQDVQFVLHDLHHPLPFEAGSFDHLISGLVLEHIRELPFFYSEVRRVLNPSGRAVFSTLHPAMFLRGSQARFTDPATGELIQPGSFNHTFGDMITSALQAGLGVASIHEASPEADFARHYPRAERYIGWPMLLVMECYPAQ